MPEQRLQKSSHSQKSFGFFSSQITEKCLYFVCNRLPVALISLWDDCPLLAATGHCRTGFVLQFWWSWVIRFVVQWVSHVVIATWVPDVSSSQFAARQLYPLKWSIAGHEQRTTINCSWPQICSSQPKLLISQVRWHWYSGCQLTVVVLTMPPGGSQ